MPNKIRLLGVDITLIEPQQAQSLLRDYLNSKGGLKQIATVNPDFLVTAHQDRKYRDLLNSADLATADGSGLIYMAKIMGQRASLDQRLTGVEITKRLLKLCLENQDKVAIIIKNIGYSSPQEISQALQVKYPGLHAEVYLQAEAEKLTEPLEAKVVFVALGSPDQDFWITQHRQLISKAKIAVGVGGTFDYISGKISRAPKIFRSLGLEWLWRFFKRPVRMSRRVWRSVIVFPLLALKEKI